MNLKSKGYVFSKYVFEAISEGEVVSKTRFEYVAGSWTGGDVSQVDSKMLGIYRPLQVKDYGQYIERSLKDN